jgi:ActR/RegA family two-component response regulator
MEAIPSLIAVMLTGHGSIASAVNAIKLGARNYITKPSTIESIENALFQTDSLARHDQAPCDKQPVWAGWWGPWMEPPY